VARQVHQRTVHDLGSLGRNVRIAALWKDAPQMTHLVPLEGTTPVSLTLPEAVANLLAFVAHNYHKKVGMSSGELTEILQDYVADVIAAAQREMV
jgi:hypothetical protein